MTNSDGPSATFDIEGMDSLMPPTGTLVISTWFEPGQEPGFRARLTYGDIRGHEPNVFSTADPDEALSAVREWLLSQPRLPGGA